MFNGIESVALALGTNETVTVTAVSGTDLFGWAKARLSNGRSKFLRHPIIGDVVDVITHPAKILRLEDRSGYQIWRRGISEPEFVSADKMHALLVRLSRGKGL